MQPLESGDGYVASECVEGFLRVFVVVPLAGEAHADTVGDVADAGLPDLLIETSVYAYVGGAHSLSGEGTNDLDRARGLAFVSILAELRMQVDGVVARDDLGPLRLSVLRLSNQAAREQKGWQRMMSVRGVRHSQMMSIVVREPNAELLSPHSNRILLNCDT